MTVEQWTRRFSVVLRNLMFKEGYTNAELARAARISKTEVTKLLSGTHKPSVYVLNNLSNALRVPMEDLTMFGEMIEY